MKPGISIATLSEFCVMNPQLPALVRDRFHVRTGREYDNRLYAPTNKYPLVSGSGNLRGGQPLWERSRQERMLDLLLNVSPWVFEIRCNFPLYRSTDDPEEIPFIVARMITVELLETPGRPHYHAVLPTADEYARAFEEFAGRGVTCELLNLHDLTETDEFNIDFCYGAIRRRQLSDMTTVAAELADMLRDSERRRAKYLRTLARLGKEITYAPKSLDSVMDALARRLGISRNEAYSRFCAALALGYLKLEPGYRLVPGNPLLLAFHGRGV